MTIEVAMFGVLGKDAESKTSKTGKPYLRLNLRIGDGDAAQWVNVMTFDPKAVEVAAQMLKGARVYVEGSVRLAEWTGQDGATRHGLSVMSWHTRLSQIGRNKPTRESNKPQSGRERAAASDYAPSELNDDIPF